MWVNTINNNIESGEVEIKRTRNRKLMRRMDFPEFYGNAVLYKKKKKNELCAMDQCCSLCTDMKVEGIQCITRLVFLPQDFSRAVLHLQQRTVLAIEGFFSSVMILM